MFNKVLITLTISGSLIGSMAYSCPRSVDQLVCPGDRVVTHDNIVGTVRAVNPFQGTIAIQSSSSGNIYTRPKTTLALGEGCLEMYCVGDRVVNNKNIIGTVIAVNPYRGTIAFQSSSSGYVYTEDLSGFALGLGCLKGVCIQDKVISADNIVGKILAVNSFDGNVAFISLSSGNVYTRPVETFSLTTYCEEYGTAQRSIVRYPVVDERSFLAPTFQFSLNRPALR